MLVLIGVWSYMKSVLFSLETFPFVLSGLSKRTTTEGLREAFAKFGEVVDGLFLSFKIIWNCLLLELLWNKLIERWLSTLVQLE